MPRQPEERIDFNKFIINHGKPSLSAGQVEEIGYGADGLIVNDTNAPSCLAKQVKQMDTNTTRYFVKFSNVGPTAGNMLDPNEETDLTRRGDWTANGRFSYRPVVKAAYDLYLQFLKTGNKAYYRQAARETQI